MFQGAVDTLGDKCGASICVLWVFAEITSFELLGAVVFEVSEAEALPTLKGPRDVVFYFDFLVAYSDVEWDRCLLKCKYVEVCFYVGTFCVAFVRYFFRYAFYFNDVLLAEFV